MSTATGVKKSKVAAAPKYNPFGKVQETRKSAMEVLQESFGIGIRDYDRGAEVWDPTHVDENGKPDPAWVHVPELSLECVIEFSVNEGKGTGRQAIPALEFVSYVNALQGIIDSGYKEPVTSDRTVYIPTPVVAASSFKLVHPKTSVPQTDGTVKSVVNVEAPRDIVSVRCTSGKGAKPMLVTQAEFPIVVEALSTIANNLAEFTAQAWAGYTAQTGTPVPGSETETETETETDEETDLVVDDTDESDPDSDE